MDARQRLTFRDATSLMVGAGVGAGIMAIPAVAAATGMLPLLIVLPVAWLLACLVHLLLAEVCLRTAEPLQLVELMRRYLLRGRWGTALLWLVFALLAVAFVAALAAYVAASAEIVTDLTGLPMGLSQVLVWALSAGAVWFGLRGVGRAERIGALALFVFVGCLVVGALGARGGLSLPLGPDGGPLELLALFGLVMYGYATYFSVPQVVRGLAPDGRAAARAIVVGLALNGLLIGLVALVALGVSTVVTPVAAVGIGDALGPWASVVCGLFILTALVTTYWSVSLALADMIRERVGVGVRPAWLAATLPSLLLLLLGLWSFLEWLSLAAGATALAVALITVPMVLGARQRGDVPHPSWTPGRLGGPGWLVVAVAATLLMAAGAVRAL